MNEKDLKTKLIYLFRILVCVAVLSFGISFFWNNNKEQQIVVVSPIVTVHVHNEDSIAPILKSTLDSICQELSKSNHLIVNIKIDTVAHLDE